MPPAEVVAFLNSYLDAMVEVVVAEGGTVDKFIGDAVMATFGVPVARGDDALRAVRAAVGMLTRLEQWNVERAARGQARLEIGIGLHTGEVLAGNIGSTRKMEYTVIGDTVNTASRIEGLNKAFHTHLLISAETYAQVRAAVTARPLEPVEVKGKREKLLVYEVSGLIPLAPS
jgi:adenylate cyclase